MKIPELKAACCKRGINVHYKDTMKTLKDRLETDSRSKTANMGGFFAKRETRASAKVEATKRKTDDGDQQKELTNETMKTMRQFPKLFDPRDIALTYAKEVLGHQGTDAAEYMKSKGHEIPSMRAEPVQYWTEQHRKNLEHCKFLEESGVRLNTKYLREDQNELPPQDLIEDLISSMPTTSWTSPKHDESAVPSRQCIEAVLACFHDTRLRSKLAEKYVLRLRQVEPSLLPLGTDGDIKTANPHIFSTDPELDDHIFSGCIPPFWVEAWSQKIGDSLPDAVSNRTEGLTIYCETHERLETFNRPPWFIVAFACGLLTREKWIEVAIGMQLDGWVKLVGSHTCGNGRIEQSGTVTKKKSHAGHGLTKETSTGVGCVGLSCISWETNHHNMAREACFKAALADRTSECMCSPGTNEKRRSC